MKLFVKDRKFYGSILTIALPVIFQHLITAGVNLMDTLMLTACGELELSGASLANQFISLFQFMSNGMGFGAAVLTAQYWGRQDRNSIRCITTLMLRVCLVLSLIFTAVSLFGAAFIMRIYTPEKDIVDQGAMYLQVSAFTFFLFGMTQCVTLVLRSVRQVRLPLIVSIVAFFVNIFFNWVFIFGNLGAPELRIRGAALGTLIARITEFTIIVGYFFLFDKRIGYRFHHLFLRCRNYVRQYVTYCIPVLISDTLLGIGNNMVSVVTGHISGSFVAANAVVTQITRMINVFTQGISNSSSIMIGNRLGEGKKKQAYEEGITFFSLSICAGIAASCVIAVICPIIVRTSNLSAETAAIADQIIKAVIITTILSSVNSVLTKGVLRGGGDTRFLMVADVLFLWLVSVPLGYLVGIVLHASAFVTYLALRSDWFIKSVWCTFRLFRGKWVDNIVKPKESEH